MQQALYSETNSGKFSAVNEKKSIGSKVNGNFHLRKNEFKQMNVSFLAFHMDYAHSVNTELIEVSGRYWIRIGFIGAVDD